MRRTMVNGIRERTNFNFESFEPGIPRIINRLDLVLELQ